jgi:hypothetical protein
MFYIKTSKHTIPYFQFSASIQCHPEEKDNQSGARGTGRRDKGENLRSFRVRDQRLHQEGKELPHI